MSRLTFLGWLKLELERMSGLKTIGIHKLAVLAQEDNSRIAEPLLLFAIETNSTSRLMSYIDESQIKQEYLDVIGLCSDKSILQLSKAAEEALPWSYRKLLSNWRAADNRAQHIEDSKRMRLERSLQLMKEKNVSNAQVYQALNLNRGNTNAYFKHKDTSKLSLDNSTRIMKYLYAL